MEIDDFSITENRDSSDAFFIINIITLLTKQTGDSPMLDYLDETDQVWTISINNGNKVKLRKEGN